MVDTPAKVSGVADGSRNSRRPGSNSSDSPRSSTMRQEWPNFRTLMLLLSVSRRRLVRGLGAEVAQQLGSLLGQLLGKEVTPIHRLSLHAVAPLPPHTQGTAQLRVPGGQRPLPAPQHQHRAPDPPARRLVGAVVLAIERRRRAVLLADGVRMLGGLQCL